jgi:hypothetical protein
MTKEDASKFKRRRQLVDDFIAEEIRTTPPEVRFEQLRTMVATAHRIRKPDPIAEAEKAEVRELWRLLKERFHAST